MAAFIAKQVVGDKLSSVKGAIGKDEEGGTNEKDDEAAREIEEARREMEEKRKEKHRKMEEERETMRQGIRDKYGLKKKEEPPEEEADPMADGRVGRKKKTPAELAAEANKEESDDEEFAKFPPNFSELSSKVSELPAKMAQGVGEITQKCVLQ
ncbi:complexin-like [Biomphalaria glabrata]|uniref:Complexin-like n=1 Tax=Biomphalaria glabrata TaxID=6526 RepID=A0A9W3AKZ7_BIOGL|nr:complexin-like [Biomphalaria glabrata]XP_055887790.1 complexin-like [Biomphalaria glabrata]XP_055887798.1 complexin-like [Biomphalaria glabrata]XP_055887802.1 complexin-like [Biomphalaria glabrata]XP_055887808.1 complexin-like [Biomphalaria glabrata]XP_055887813.1 complexin-like [Biomphalaria glabrata]XP_055887824.1 complexin-like [Biomphalaria glabrata]XP_055887831.1 complexin-like [Biomphalaria glabrata]XP_055887837.1 complexin-like [Biomphalaria glabrata]XP_055887840.1 complexin-like